MENKLEIKVKEHIENLREAALRQGDEARKAKKKKDRDMFNWHEGKEAAYKLEIDWLNNIIKVYGK